MFWKNWSFSFKALLISILSLGLFSAIVIFAISSQKTTTDTLSALITDEAHMQAEVKEIQALMLQCRRNEKDFLLRLDPKYIERLRGNHRQLSERSQKLAQKATEAGYPHIANLARTIHDDSNAYLRSFIALSDSWKTMGLDHKSGLQGSFRKAVHGMEERLKAFSNTDQQINLLLLRRWEKDYVRTQDDKYAHRLNRTLEEQFELLEFSHLDEADKHTLRVAMVEYEDAWLIVQSLLKANPAANISDPYNRVRKAAHVYEELIHQNNISHSNEQLLMVRRREKDYLLRHDDKYIHKTRDEIAYLEKMINDSFISDEHKSELRSYTDQYIQDFNALVKEYSRAVELKSQMRAAIHKTEEPIEEIASLMSETLVAASEAAQLNAASNAATLRNSALFTFLLTLGLSGLMAWNNRRLDLQLKSIMQKLSRNAKQTTASTEQIRDMSKSLADGSSQQAASLEECHAALEEILGNTRDNTSNAQSATELTANARSVAERGAEEMVSMAEAMEAIKASSDNVANIIKTIDEIAFQTNILALNAAVEAARAGEAGAGFAVVADEVRSLAQRSATAAKETTEKIEDAISKSIQGVEINSRVGDILNDIVGKVYEVDQIISGIAKASSDQNNSIEELNIAVGGMNSLVQVNAASSEEAASSVQELDFQVKLLEQVSDELSSVVGSRVDNTNDLEIPMPTQTPAAPRYNDEDWGSMDVRKTPAPDLNSNVHFN